MKLVLRKIMFNPVWRGTGHFYPYQTVFAFPNELCYGYLRFKGNGKIPLADQIN